MCFNPAPASRESVPCSALGLQVKGVLIIFGAIFSPLVAPHSPTVAHLWEIKCFTTCVNNSAAA